jgi:hypothetical protein
MTPTGTPPLETPAEAPAGAREEASAEATTHASADAWAGAVADASAHASALRALFDRVQGRRTVAFLAPALAGMQVIANVLLPWLLPGVSLTTQLLRYAIALAPFAAWLVVRGRSRPVPSPARAIEARAGGCDNLLVTAEELLRHPERARPGIRDHVLALAAARARALDVPRLFPVARPVVLCVVAIAAGTSVMVATRDRPGLLAPSRRAGSPPGTPGVAGGDGLRVEVAVESPAYLRRPDTTLVDPARIEVTAGSRLRLRVEARADAVRLETLEGRRALSAGDAPNAPGRPRTFTGDLLATADGFLALEATAGGDAPPVRRLVGLSVREDPPPRVRITAPGRDLFIPDGNRALDIAIEAEDDHALASLRLRYTRVSGSGERFTFSEGEVPVAVTRRDGARWTARAAWALAPLALEPGDVLVYRALAADDRPGAPPVESDAFLAEVLMPGGEAASGFALDADEERYALSQQMIVLKTERLEARRGALSTEAFAQEAAALAAEQRRVRAEFVFMMGGEFAELVTDETAMGELDETHEAEAEDDLSAGRMANRGRSALLAAIRAMSRAAVRLTEADTRAALPLEREAVKQLEEAFARSRFLMRALSQRERLDEARRLSGTADGTGRRVGPEAAGAAPSRAVALRRVLADVAALAAAPAPAPGDAAAMLAAAQAVLREDPSGDAARAVAARLEAAAGAARAGRAADARAALAEAATALGAELGRSLRVAPAGRALERRRLEGALADRRAR